MGKGIHYAYSVEIFKNMVSENELNDILLLNLLKADDEKAFKYIFDRYFSPLCRFMYLYVKNQQEVEEMSLDIFTHVWENRATLEIKLTFKAYLFQAARNKCLNNIRDRKNTCSIEESGYDACLEDSSVEVNELNRIIEEAILSLPEKFLEVFRKIRKEHLPNQEIAKEMQISVKTVEAQITKALKMIRKYLGETYSYIW